MGLIRMAVKGVMDAVNKDDDNTRSAPQQQVDTPGQHGWGTATPPPPPQYAPYPAAGTFQSNQQYAAPYPPASSEQPAYGYQPQADQYHYKPQASAAPPSAAPAGSWAPSTPPDRNSLHGRMLRWERLLGFAPWIVGMVLQDTNIKACLIAATSCAGGLLLFTLVMKLLKFKKIWPMILDTGLLITLAILLGVVYGPGDCEFVIQKWFTMLLHAGMTTTVATSIVLRYPFTLQVAREKAPEQFWHHPGFIKIAYILSYLWFAIFGLSTLSAMIVSVTNSRENSKSAINIIFNYIIPFGLLFLGMFLTKFLATRLRNKYMADVVEEMRARKARGEPVPDMA